MNISDINEKQKNILGIIGLLIILVGNAMFLNYNAFQDFNFYDMCFSLDGGWRIINGQKPYVDFFYYNGPLHLYIMAFFIKIFGFTKSAVFSYLILTHSIVITVVFFTARRFLNFWTTLLVILLTATSFYWPISHPWHDQTAYMWCIFALALLVRNLNTSNSKKAFGIGVFCGLMSVLSAMTKLNIGGAYAVLLFFVLLTFEKRKHALTGFVAGIISGIIFMKIFIPDPTKFFDQIIEYASWAKQKRVNRLTNISSWFRNFYWIPFTIVIYSAMEYWRKEKAWMVLFVGFTIFAIFTVFSGGIVVESNVFLWGIYMMLSFIIMQRIGGYITAEKRKKIHKILNMILVIVAVGFIFRSVQISLQLKVWSYSLEGPDRDYSIKAKPFDGWKCSSYRGVILDNVVSYINQYVPKDESLLVISEMSIVYALTGRDSYRKLPLYTIQKNHVPLPGRQVKETREYIQANLPDWIVTDLSMFVNEVPYLGLFETIKNKYILRHSWGAYAIFSKIK